MRLVKVGKTIVNIELMTDARFEQIDGTDTLTLYLAIPCVAGDGDEPNEALCVELYDEDAWKLWNWLCSQAERLD